MTSPNKNFDKSRFKIRIWWSVKKSNKRVLVNWSSSYQMFMWLIGLLIVLSTCCQNYFLVWRILWSKFDLSFFCLSPTLTYNEVNTNYKTLLSAAAAVKEKSRSCALNWFIAVDLEELRPPCHWWHFFLFDRVYLFRSWRNGKHLSIWRAVWKSFIKVIIGEMTWSMCGCEIELFVALLCDRVHHNSSQECFVSGAND